MSSKKRKRNTPTGDFKGLNDLVGEHIFLKERGESGVIKMYKIRSVKQEGKNSWMFKIFMNEDREISESELLIHMLSDKVLDLSLNNELVVDKIIYHIFAVNKKPKYISLIYCGEDI